MAFTAPVLVPVVDAANRPLPTIPSRYSSPSSPPGQLILVSTLESNDHRRGNRPQCRHRTEYDETLASIYNHPAESPGKAEADHQDQYDLEQIRQARRILERVSRVGIEESTAIGSQQLDHLLGGNRATLDHLLSAGDGLNRLRCVEVLDHSTTQQ